MYILVVVVVYMEKWKKSILFYPVRLFLKPFNFFVIFIIVK